MLTDEIMDEVEMNTGVPKKQQRITYQSTQRTTRQALKYYNTQENDTIDLSIELKGGTGRQTQQSTPHWTQKKLPHNDSQTTKWKTITRRASKAGVDVPESADVDTTVEQLKHEMERLAKQNHDRIAATLGATLSTMRQENNTRFAREKAKIEDNTNALESIRTIIDARIDALENRKSSSSSGSRTVEMSRIQSVP